MSLLIKVKRRLKELKVPYSYVGLSDNPNKKIKIIVDGKVVHFGARNSTTHLESPNEKKRQAYQSRASKITNKAGEYTYQIPYTANFLAYHILW